MVGSQQILKAGSHCTLCPAGCQMGLAASGPDIWRSEVSPDESGALCPRGWALGELISSNRRILSPPGGSMRAALRAVSQAAAGKELLILLDANLPCEQLLAADAWCRAWPQARLCLVMEPADAQLLLGTESAGAEYLADQALAACDGFVIVGDAFAANPCCARGIFERRAAEARTPIVVIDPAVGSAAKFATHSLAVSPGGELAALSAVAAAAGLDDVTVDGDATAPARAAGKALANCRNLAVILAAEYGRSADWRRIGHFAARLAKAHGGGVACQTVGANALAALRLQPRLEVLSLAEALQDDAAAWIVLGCDVLGMLGWSDRKLLAAAAPVANTTTAAARFVLPAAAPVEMGGTFLLSGARQVKVERLLAPPADVPTPAEIVEQLARLAGVAQPRVPQDVGELRPLGGDAPPATPSSTAAAKPTLLLGRQAAHSGCGALTAGATWQAAVQPVMVLRVSPADAGQAGLPNLAEATLRVGDRSAKVTVRISQELPSGTMVLPEGFAQARGLLPSEIDKTRGALVALPAGAAIEA